MNPHPILNSPAWKKQAIDFLGLRFEWNWAKKFEGRGSKYDVILGKPRGDFGARYGLTREVLFLLGDFPTVEPRTFLIFKDITDDREISTRSESMMFVVVGAGGDFNNAVLSLRHENAFDRIEIPFFWSELKDSSDSKDVISDRFDAVLFRKDLFDIRRPITDTAFFFGRKELIFQSSKSLMAGEHLGIFGLRKSGKTSFMYQLERHIVSDDKAVKVVRIDAQNPSVYLARWYDVIRVIRDAVPRGQSGGIVTAETAIAELKKAIDRAVRKGEMTRLIVMIDEVEHLFPRTALHRSWDEDFLHFFKGLRAIGEESKISLLICGVNACPIECGMVSGHDNPLYSMMQIRYIPFFNRGELDVMIKSIGRLTGIVCSDTFVDDLMKHTNGHPQLARIATSIIVKQKFEKDPRPIYLSGPLISTHKNEVYREMGQNVTHILAVLKEWYPTEFLSLKRISQGEEFKGDDSEISHLINYHMVSNDGTGVTMEIVREIASNDNDGEIRLMEVSQARNRLEPNLRKLVAQTLKTKHGIDSWTNKLVEVFGDKKERLIGKSGKEIIEKEMFLMQLCTVIVKNWSDFDFLSKGPKQVAIDKVQFQAILAYIDRNRVDAHAGEISEAELATYRIAIDTISKAILPYVE